MPGKHVHLNAVHHKLYLTRCKFYPLTETNFQDSDGIFLDAKLHILSVCHTFHIFYLRLTDFKNFPEPAAFFQDLTVLENFQVLQHRPHEPCLTIISHVAWFDQLNSRSTQRCESLTYLPGPCDERLIRIGNVSVTASEGNTGRKPFPPSLAKIERAKFRDAEKLYRSTSVCTQTGDPLHTLILRYLRKVQRISGEFLSDFPYILCCISNFSPRVNPQSTYGE